ncbi:hypothetical protein OS493_015961 [Desmophyllum pertusum]|uniref:Major facilitator superfamily (MFS) profile domain-containing protein n=1 Tax=Desmophyllum pertusum TaxID=174260 RepID=A0A9X0CF86_9CNID|nr:hypothetical protein OS493_015961 [Desmophyllum pertusum]
MTGGFGRYQTALYIFIGLVAIPTGAQLQIPVFYAISPPFTCVSVSGNTSCPVGKCCSSCVEYEFKGAFTSAVSEWDLICDRRHLRAMTRAVFMVGLLIGAAVFSAISDHFGRKLSFFMSIGFLAASGVVSAVADCLSLFSLFRFFAGAATIGCILVRFVYIAEMVVTAHRSWVGIIIMTFLAIGGCILTLLAYLISNWRHLMLAVSLPGFLPLLAWWNVNAIIYYGINYNVHNLAGNVYLNYFLLMMVNFPSTVICCYTLKRFGRRLTYCVFMLIGGVTCLLAVAVPTNQQAAVVTLVIFARFCVVATFTSIYLYTAELYPTVIRNNGVGACSTVARIGGIITPYIVLLSDLPNLWKTFPLLILGVLGVAAGIMAFWLPETVTSQMPQTVEQAEAWDEDYKIYCCRKPQIQAPHAQGLEMEAEEKQELEEVTV